MYQREIARGTMHVQHNWGKVSLAEVRFCPGYNLTLRSYTKMMKIAKPLR